VGTSTLPPIRTRVAAGAALLDQRRPGWHQQVEPDRLDLLDSRSDVLGQLYGFFGAGVRRLTAGLAKAEVDAWTIANGLDLDDTDLALAAGPTGAYRLLTAPLADQIRRRLGGEGR
jgi:hypothetical protein